MRVINTQLSHEWLEIEYVVELEVAWEIILGWTTSHLKKNTQYGQPWVIVSWKNTRYVWNDLWKKYLKD